MRVVRTLAVLTAALLAPAALLAQDEDSPFGDEDLVDEPEPAERGATDASTPAWTKARELQRKGKWKQAKKAFEEVLEEFPDSVHKEDIEARAGENSYLGCEPLWISGPASRRIDVSVMGDGFLIDTDAQDIQKDWADLCIQVLHSDDAYREYKNYFNFYLVRLESAEEGVDERAPPEEQENAKKRNKERRKSRKKKKGGPGYDFNTALDCKAAGPQGQVMSDRTLVYHWLRIAQNDVPGCGDDNLVIVFAKFGKLGMAGGGIANVGRPDNSVTVHEFGHAFAFLNDEYANQPNTEPPTQFFRPAPNASLSDDPNLVPWKHFLDEKVKGVGIYEGGSTFQKFVWRPAASGCAMNSAGATGYCPVCREAAILCIYAIVNPIDMSSPNPRVEMSLTEGADDVITVVPMQPESHDLAVEWFVDAVPGSDPGPEAVPEEERTYANQGFTGVYTMGPRAREQDRELIYSMPPWGVPSDLAKKVKGRKDEPTKHVFAAGKLPPGRWQVTVVVRDETPWVLKDEKKVLEERESWFVTVTPKRR